MRLNDEILGRGLAIAAFAGGLARSTAAAQEMVEAPPEAGLTLLQVIFAGGPIIVGIMLLLVVLSVVALALIITFFATLSSRRETSPNFVAEARALMQQRDVEACELFCKQHEDKMLTCVLRAGLRVAGQDRAVIVEATQSEGERLAAALSQQVAYLSNIATLAPMLGLLGTVAGMWQGFKTIASPGVGMVKSIVMAGHISNALTTTMVGLLVAIPITAFYFYFRGRVQRFVAALEGASAEFVELLARMGGGKQ